MPRPAAPGRPKPLPITAARCRPAGEARRDSSLLPPHAIPTQITRKAVSDLAFGLAVSAGAVWLFLAYLGVV